MVTVSCVPAEQAVETAKGAESLPRVKVSELPDIVRQFYRISERVYTPLLLIGPPGIGKTASIAEAAVRIASELARRVGGRVKVVDLSGELAPVKERLEKEYGVEIVIPRSTEEIERIYNEIRGAPPEERSRYFIYDRVVATQLTPDDIEMLKPQGDYATVLAPLRLAFFMVPGVPGILFIDEITNVRIPALQSLLFALVNEKRLAMVGKLGDKVYVVAAGNPPEVSSAAAELPAPLINRFAVFEVEPPTASEMLKIIERLLGNERSILLDEFLRTIGSEHAYMPPSDIATLVNYPTPRSLTRLSAILYELEREYLEGKISDDRFIDEVEKLTLALTGPQFTKEFMSFLQRVDWRKILQRVKFEREARYYFEHPEEFVKLPLTDANFVAKYIAAYIADLAERYTKGRMSEAEKEKVYRDLINFVWYTLLFKPEYFDSVRGYLVETSKQRGVKPGKLLHDAVKEACHLYTNEDAKRAAEILKWVANHMDEKHVLLTLKGCEPELCCKAATITVIGVTRYGLKRAGEEQ